MDCAQVWYGESEPDETGELRFEMKMSSPGHLPSSGDIAAAKESLCVIWHGGFDEAACKQLGCQNRRLRGRYLCQRHFTLP